MSAAGGGTSATAAPVPTHAQIPLSSLVVDAFKTRSAQLTYFLSHFHADHYTGINHKWNYSKIFCSQITAALLEANLAVDPAYIAPLPMHSRIPIHRSPLSGTITIQPDEIPPNGHIVLLDANHCPGAAMLLVEFESDDGKRKKYLHTGDFRFHQRMTSWQEWQLYDLPIDTLFLDTTYCHPKHKFPLSGTITRTIAEQVQKTLLEDNPPHRKTLVVVSTYTIGKERLLLALASLHPTLKIYVSQSKLRTLSLLDLDSPPLDESEHLRTTTPNAMDVFTTDTKDPTPFHVASWGAMGEMAPGGWRFVPDWTKCRTILESANAALPHETLDKYTHFLGIVPTGWTWGLQKNTEKLFETIGKDGWGQIWTVPYSEHSSYEELRSFVGFLRPARVVATVGQPSCASRFRDLVDNKRAHGDAVRGLFGGGAKSEGVGENNDDGRRVDDEEGDDDDDEDEGKVAKLLAAAAASSTTATATTPTGTWLDGNVAREKPQKFDPCPLLCGKSFASQSQLQSHVDSCLEQQQSSRKRPRSPPPRPSPLSASPTTRGKKAKKAVTATTTTAKQTTLFQFFKGADRT
ncbi:beta-lactamase-like protein [Cladochytrium replicatum]|nr:beta-lactamase-like protein [Cladochytrium replicatum]